MAFFSKLKERLFRSSSKLDEGLDAIVEDGGEEEAAEGGRGEERGDSAEDEQVCACHHWEPLEPSCNLPSINARH